MRMLLLIAWAGLCISYHMEAFTLSGVYHSVTNTVSVEERIKIHQYANSVDCIATKFDRKWIELECAKGPDRIESGWVIGN